MPASIIALSISGELQAGPIVATILVFRIGVWPDVVVFMIGINSLVYAMVYDYERSQDRRNIHCG